MISYIKLNEYLFNNAEFCVKVLEDIGYQDITQRGNELRFARIGGTNKSSVLFSLDTLKFKCFSTDEYGNLYTMVMKNKGMTFPQALTYIAQLLGIEGCEVQKANIKYPFNGFFKKLIREIVEPEYAMDTYSDDVLKQYSGVCNLMFLKDGIDFETQEKFSLGYDYDTHRIAVPEFTLNGELCGIMGRLNDPNCTKEERWLPIIPCSRSLTLYGYHFNYSDIQQKDLVIIGESEKFVQQLDTMGCHIGLALCGRNISSIQAKHIKGLLTKNIILALDEGITECDMIYELKKLRLENPIIQNHLGYIYDKDNEILPKGSKASPSDLGRDAFVELVNKHTVWIQ